jgi:hypothetical protein
MHHRVTTQTPNIATWSGVCPIHPTLMVPNGASQISSSTRADLPCKAVALLPSYTCGLHTTITSSADYISTVGSWCIAVNREGLSETMVRSPVLVAIGMARDGYEGVTGHATDQ